MTEDAYNGDAQFSLTIDGISLETARSVTTARSASQAYNTKSAGPGQTFTYPGNWNSVGPHTVVVKFLNDAYLNSATTDRNLYLNGLTYNGINYPAAIALLSSTGDTFSIKIGTAAPPQPLPPPVVVVVPPTNPVPTTASAVIPSYTIPATPSGAKTLNPNGGSDAGPLQAALVSGGSYIVKGTLKIPTIATGGAKVAFWCTPGSGFSVTTGSYGISWSGNGFEMYNCDFAGGGILLTGKGGHDDNVFIAGNTFHDITNGNDAVNEGNTLGTNSWIDANKFLRITPVPNGVPAWEGPGSGFFANGFLNNVKITNNVCDLIGYDCLKGFFNQNAGPAIGFIHAGNRATRVHRIGFEFQDCSSNSNGCYSGTTGSSNGAVFKDNYFSDPWYPDRGTFAFSWPVDHSSTNLLINNTAILNVPCCNSSNVGWVGYGMEISGNTPLIQGNVVSTYSRTANSGNAPGWGCPLCFDNSNAGNAQNNYLCGSGSSIKQGGLQANGVVFPQNNKTPYNLVSTSSCPWSESDFTKSNISAAFTGPSTVAVTSRLSVASVQFTLDGQPIGTQEISTVNTNFANDPRWLYTLPGIDTTKLSSGSHSIIATATDVLGASTTAASSLSVQ